MYEKIAASLVLIGLVVVGTVAPVAGATQDATAESFAVDLSADGSATVTVTTTFDLTDDNESDAFAELRDDDAARERFRTRFRDRMAGVAADAANATGREMAITDASIAFRTEGDTGVVEQSVTWDGLAAVDGDRLVVTEPFASGFEPDRQFRVVAPDGYELDATPAPDGTADGAATWNAGAPLDGFEVTASPSETPMATATPPGGGTATDGDTPTEGGTTAGSGPGFGAALTVLALLSLAALVARDQ